MEPIVELKTSKNFNLINIFFTDDCQAIDIFYFF